MVKLPQVLSVESEKGDTFDDPLKIPKMVLDKVPTDLLMLRCREVRSANC